MLSPEYGCDKLSPGAGTSVREIAVVLLASFALVALFSYLPYFVPYLSQYSSVLIAATFIYLPTIAIWRRKRTLSEIGVVARFSLPDVMSTFAVVLLVFPIFTVGFFFYQEAVESRDAAISSDRLMAWPDELEFWADPLPEGLVLGARGDRIAIYNNRSQAAFLKIDWTPAELDGRKIPFARRGGAVSLSVRPGRLQLKSGQALLLDQGVVSVDLDELPIGAGPGGLEKPGGPAGGGTSAGDVGNLDAGRKEGASGPKGKIVLGNGRQVSLPFQADRGYSWLLFLVLTQLLLVALPEEIFYRGYVQTGLSALMKRRFMVFGGDVGPAVLVTSVMFAVGHLIAIPAADRLAVFFPSLLFGWLRSRTGSVLPAVLLHCLSNVLLALLNRFI